jgi:hypothetical protein
MRLLVIALACFVLTGCWYGISLYAPSDARPAVPAGVYLTTAKDEPRKALRVSILPNGFTQFDGGEKKEIYGFAPLDPARGTYVMWVPVKDDDPKASGEPGEYQIYLLMVRQRDGEYRIYPPDCKDEEGEIARRNGATIESGPPASCHFTNRASLEAAMRELPRDEASAATLKRVP